MENPHSKPYVIGISGSSGSGKTFFLNCFLKHFNPGEVALVSQDDYYIPSNTKTKEENKLYNFDLPTSFDRDRFFQDIQSLISGEAVTKEEYTFNNPSLKPKTLSIEPARILIVEGLFIFHYTEINDLLDHRIFIDANEEVALQRRIQRDFIERGYEEDDVLYKWNNHVVPAYKEYLLPYKKSCNQVIENNSNDPKEIIQASSDISTYLRQFFF